MHHNLLYIYIHTQPCPCIVLDIHFILFYFFVIICLITPVGNVQGTRIYNVKLWEMILDNYNVETRLNKFAF